MVKNHGGTPELQIETFRFEIGENKYKSIFWCVSGEIISVRSRCIGSSLENKKASAPSKHKMNAYEIAISDSDITTLVFRKQIMLGQVGERVTVVFTRIINEATQKEKLSRTIAIINHDTHSVQELLPFRARHPRLTNLLIATAETVRTAAYLSPLLIPAGMGYLFISSCLLSSALLTIFPYRLLKSVNKNSACQQEFEKNTQKIINSIPITQ